MIIPLRADAAGQLVVTPLNAYARPLLRLSTGDAVDVSLGEVCPCGSTAPVITIHGRNAERLMVGETALTARGLDEIVFGVEGLTGYPVEATRDGSRTRLIAERDIDWDHDEYTTINRLQQLSQRTLGMHWDRIAFVNQLPTITKSGGGQKNWKRTNVRVVEAIR